MPALTILWRSAALGNTHTSADRIELDDTAATPDARTGLMNIRAVMDKSKPKNSEPFAESVIKADTGYDGTMLELEILLDETDGDSLAPRRLLRWASENQTPRLFPNGNIGLKTVFLKEYDLVPTANDGYKIIKMDDYRDNSFPAKRILKLYLEHSGELKNLAGPVAERAG